jgi:hypothetical protein
MRRQMADTRRNNGARASWVVATITIALTWAAPRPAFCADTLSFPPTSFTILNPDTGVAVGRSQYHVDETPDGATLRGVNSFYDDQSDVETSLLDSHAGGEPRLIEFDHTFFNPDGSIVERGHLDTKSGAATCVDNTGGQKRTRATVLSVPDNTWAGASIVIPIQAFLRAGGRGSAQSLNVFSCAPGPKIFAVTVKADPKNAAWTPYGAEALRVEIRPDFGVLNLIVASFVPKLHAWFDPNDGWAFVGDEAARWYKGPHVMLVKTRAAGAKRP